MVTDVEALLVKTCYQFVKVIELTKQGLDVRIAEVKKQLARVERC